MQLSFYFLAMLIASIFAILAAIWVLAPTRFLSAWRLDDTASLRLIGRRAGALYAGIATTFFLARNAESTVMLSALIYGLMTTCIMLAIFGIYDFVKGNASKGILSAVVIEVVLSLMSFMAV